MNRRRGGIGIFGFIIIMTILDWFFEGGIYLLFDFLLPLGIFAMIVYGFYRLFQLFFSVPETGRRNSRDRIYNRSDTRQSRANRNRNSSAVKKSSNQKIDAVLSEYFKNNVSLILFDDVAVSAQGGKYTTVDNLYVTHKGEKICQVKEFRDQFPTSYDKIIESLAKLAEKGGDAVKVEAQQKQQSGKKKPASDAEMFIEQISELNNDIYNEEVTNGLYQTCDLLKQIDMADREDGKVDSKLNKLYQYYLPILTGILENYKRLSVQDNQGGVQSEEFKKCETQLVKTIKLINEALKTIYNSLHESDYMNLNADINTLQYLLKQDGLVDTPFKGGTND